MSSRGRDYHGRHYGRRKSWRQYAGGKASPAWQARRERPRYSLIGWIRKVLGL